MYRIPFSTFRHFLFLFAYLSLPLFLNFPPPHILYIFYSALSVLPVLSIFCTASLPKPVPRFFGRGPRENNNEQRDFPTRHSDHSLSLFLLFLKALINIKKTGHR